MKISIIGGGPVGCYTGYLFAKEGHLVTIYENHPLIGSPIQCTGILTNDFDDFGFPLKSFLVNTINKIEVISPSGEEVLIKQKDYIVCRNKFDNFFADLAKKAGAKILVNHSFIRKEGKAVIIKDSLTNKEIKVTPDLVIGADGPLSPTAKAFGFYNSERKNYYGVQAVVEGKFEPGTIKTYFGQSICPGLFAWIVPESSTIARVGIAAVKDSRKYFDKFMKENNFKAKEIQAGTIPIYHPRQKLHQDNCYLVGDAAGFVKATTLGGLIPGLKQAEIMVKSVLEGKDYEVEIKPLRRKMKIHLMIHNILDKFSDKDFDKMVRYVNQPKIQKIFEQHTRENPLPILLKAGLKEPRFAYFVKYLW
ncbi:MAG: NAD(P)/FAD-dependent oxidoreductase [archaeon]|nr:NAD(P)/FAD-dependent oxidoreductase [archaeon]